MNQNTPETEILAARLSSDRQAQVKSVLVQELVRIKFEKRTVNHND